MRRATSFGASTIIVTDPAGLGSHRIVDTDNNDKTSWAGLEKKGVMITFRAGPTFVDDCTDRIGPEWTERQTSGDSKSVEGFEIVSEGGLTDFT